MASRRDAHGLLRMWAPVLLAAALIFAGVSSSAAETNRPIQGYNTAGDEYYQNSTAGNGSYSTSPPPPPPPSEYNQSGDGRNHSNTTGNGSYSTSPPYYYSPPSPPWDNNGTGQADREFNSSYGSVDVTNRASQTMMTSNGSRAVGVMLTVNTTSGGSFDGGEVRVMMCFYPVSEFNAFRTKGYQAGNASKALEIGMFNCSVKFNGTKYPAMPTSASASRYHISHVKHVPWTEDTAVVVTWGKYFHSDVAYNDAQEVFENMTVSFVGNAEKTVSNAQRSFMLKPNYPTVTGPYIQYEWEDMNGTTQGGGYSANVVFEPRTSPWNVVPMAFYYAFFDSEANALSADALDVVRLGQRCQSTAGVNVLCSDSLTGYTGKAGNQNLTWAGEMSSYVVFNSSGARQYVRAVPAILAAQYPANSCGKDFDLSQSAIGSSSGPDTATGRRRMLSYGYYQELEVMCPEQDLGSLLLDPYAKLVTTVYTIEEIHNSAVLKNNLTWSAPVSSNSSNQADIPLKITLLKPTSGIVIYWAQVSQNNFYSLYDGGDPQRIVDAQSSLNAWRNGSFVLSANLVDFQKTLVSVSKTEAAYIYVAVEVDGVLERKFHKFKVPSFDSLTYWKDGSPSASNAVLNYDSLSFSTTISGMLTQAVYKTQITYAALEFDQQTWDNMTLAPKTQEEVSNMYSGYKYQQSEIYANLQGGRVVDGGETELSYSTSFSARLLSVSALKVTVYFFSYWTSTARGNYHSFEDEVKNVTLKWEGAALSVPPPPPTFVTNQQACPKLELFFQFDRYPAETSYELAEYPVTPGGFFRNGGPAVNPTDLHLVNNTFSYTYEMCQSSAYTLKVLDSSGDGMCCGYGEGYYTLKLIKPNGEFMMIKDGRSTTGFSLEKTDFKLDVILSPSPPPPPSPPSPPSPSPPPPERAMTISVKVRVGAMYDGLGFFYLEEGVGSRGVALYRETGMVPAEAYHSAYLSDSGGFNLTEGDWFTFPDFSVKASGREPGAIVVFDQNNFGLGADGLVQYIITSNTDKFESQFFRYPSGDSVGIDLIVPYNRTDFAQLSRERPPFPPPSPPPSPPPTIDATTPPVVLVPFPALRTDVVGVRTLKEGAAVPWIYFVYLESQPLMLPINITIGAAPIYYGRMNFGVNDGAYQSDSVSHEITADNWTLPIKVTVTVPEDDIVEDSRPLSTFVYHAYQSQPSLLDLAVSIESNDDPGVMVTIPANEAYTGAPTGHAFNTTFDNQSNAYVLTIEEGFNVTTMVALMKRARPAVSVLIGYKLVTDSAQSTGLVISPSSNIFRLTDAAPTFKSFKIEAVENSKVTGDRIVELKLETVSSLNSYGCEGAFAAFGSSVCGDLFRIIIKDNDRAGVQIGDVPPDDASLLSLWTPSAAGRDATIMEGSSFGTNGSYSFGMTLRAEPNFQVIVKPVVRDVETGQVVTDQIRMSPPSVTFQPTQWNNPQKVQIMADADNTVEGPKQYSISWVMQSGDVMFNEGTETEAVVQVSVTDADQANITIVKLSSETRFSETGEPVRYSIKLSSLPTSNVTLLFTPRISTNDAVYGSNLARRAVFEAQSPSIDSYIKATPSNITIATGSSDSFTFEVGFDTTNTDGQVTGDVPIEVVVSTITNDKQYNGSTQTLDLQAGDEDTLGFITENTDALLEENGTDVRVGVKLKTKPLSAIRILVSAPISAAAGSNNTAPQISITNSHTAGSAVNLTFTPDNWNTFQHVNITAIDDSEVEQVHSATLRFTGSSYNGSGVTDMYYDGYVENRVVLIEDNDLAVAAKVVDATAGDTVTTVTGVAASFPPSATNVSTNFSVSELKTTDIAAPMNATQFKAKAATVSFEPSTNFSKPVTISIPLPEGVSSTDESGGELHFVGAASATAGDWTPVNGTVCRNNSDSTKQICSVDVEHFSLYTIAVISSTVQATSCPSAALTCADEVITFSEDGPKLAIWPDATIAVLPDAGSNTQNPNFDVSSMVVTVSTGYLASEDVLYGNLTGAVLTDSAGCRVGKMPTGPSLASLYDAKTCWNAQAGTLTISKPDGQTLTLAHARDALKQVTYRNTNSATPNTRSRRFSVQVKEPYSAGESKRMSRYVTVTPVNDPPTLTTSTTPRYYVEAGDAVRVDPGITVGDVDSLLKSAKVTMSPVATLAKSTDFVLSTLGDASVTGISYVVDSSVPGEYSIKFTGDANAAAYQSALRSITFRNDGPYLQSTNRTFTFSVTDLSDATTSATRELVITPVNNAPEVSRTPIPIFVNEDQEVTGSFDGATDCDKSANCIDGTLSFNVTCPPSKGTVFTTPGSPSFRYVPNADAFGTDTFVYQAFDGALTSNLGSVQITINPIADDPKVSNLVLPSATGKMTVCSAAQRIELESFGDYATCGGVNFTMPGRDPDDPSVGFNLDAYFIMSEPQYGTLTIAASEQNAETVALGATQAGKNPASFQLTKEQLGGLEPTSVTFSFRVRNVDGRYSSAAVPGVVTINLQHGNDVNTPPTATASVQTMAEDTVLNGVVSASDPDVGEALTLSIETQAANGVVAVVDAAALSYSYTPNVNFVGQDSFTYRVTDRRQGSATAVVTIEVQNVNDAAIGACQIPAGVPAATAALAVAETAKIKAGTSGVDNLTPTTADHVFEGVTNGMADHQVAKQWLKDPPAASKLLDLELLTGVLEGVGTRDEILKSWHVACGSTVFADGGSTSDRYLVALVGYDIEDSVANGGSANPLNFVITEVPTVGKLFQASYVNGVLTKGNELAALSEVSGASFGAAGLVWYEPEVTYSGAVSFTWTVTDSARTVASEEYIFGTHFECGPGYTRVVDAATGAVSCAACPAGFVNTKDTFGQMECLPCPPGESQAETAQTACLGCGAGTFNPITGQATCATCPVQDPELMTSKARSVSVDSCYCKTGSFANSTGLNKMCFACSPVTLCDEVDQVIPKSLDDGFWIDPEDGNNVIQCNPPGACITHADIAGVLSGNCSDGYVDKIPGCRTCEIGHYRDLQGGFGYCVTCPVVPWYTYAIGAGALLLVLPLLMKASKLQNGFGAINIFISYAQVLSMFSELNFEWPISVQTMFKDLALFNLNFFSLSPPECLSSDWSYINKFWITNTMPLMYVFGFSIIGVCAYLHFLLNKTFRPLLHAMWPALAELYPVSGEDVSEEDAKRIKEELKEHGFAKRMWNNIGHSFCKSFTPLMLKRFLFSLAQAFLLFLLWFYFMLTESTFDYFDCVKSNDGKFYMRGDPSMECWNFTDAEPNLHTQLLPLAIFSVLAYPIGIMALFGSLFYRYRHILKQRSKLNAIMNPTEEEAETIETLRMCERRFGFLFRRYEDEWFWWELVIMARKLTYSMCGTLLSSPMEQLLTMIFLLTAFASIFLNARPYDKTHLDVMECISLISNLILLFAGFMFFSELLSEYDTNFTAYSVQILLVTSLLILAIFIIADTLPSVYFVVRALINERKQAKLDKLREQSSKGNLTLRGGESEGGGLGQRTLKSNMSRFKMIAKVTVPQRITKVLTAAGMCFTKDVVDKLREYLWMEGIGDKETTEVERYVYYVNNARLAVEAKKRREDLVLTAAAEARAEGRDADADAMMMESDAPVRLGYVLNASHADEFTYWMAFEAGANEQDTLVHFLDFFKKWERYEQKSNATGFLGGVGGVGETAALEPSHPLN